MMLDAAIGLPLAVSSYRTTVIASGKIGVAVGYNGHCLMNM